MTSSINFSHSARRKLLITGVPPQVIINRVSAAFDLSIWRQTRPIDAQLASQVEGHDAVIVMPCDKLDAARFEQRAAAGLSAAWCDGGERGPLQRHRLRRVPPRTAHRRALARPANATLLPHIGSAIQEVRTAMGMLGLDGIESHFNSEPAANLLNLGGYG